MTTQRNEFSFKGKNIYVGIDVHLKSWTATILSESTHLKTYRLDPSPDALYSYLSRTYPGASFHSVYEAGFSGYGAHRRLIELGVDNIVINPADVPTTGKEKLRKTDAVDSAKLARSLRNKDLKPIFIPDEYAQELRSLVRLHGSITKDQTRVKNRIKSHLRFHGIDVPREFSSQACWSNAFVLWLENVSTVTPYGKYVLDSHIARLKVIRQERLSILRKMREVAMKEPIATDVSLLTSIPGIGEITALRLLAEIMDIKRFKDADHLAGFVGLVPTCHKTGDDSDDDNGSITPRANRNLRGALIEASWTAIRMDPALTLAYENYCKRMRGTDAIVKIAKKLINRIYYVMKKQRPYVTSTI